MEKSIYFVKGLAALSLVSSLALASDLSEKSSKEIPLNTGVKSSIQVPENANELDEKRLAKLDVNDVANMLHHHIDGKIIQVKLENEDNNLVYQAEVLTKNNEMTDITIDAGNGTILLSKIDATDFEHENDADDHDKVAASHAFKKERR